MVLLVCFLWIISTLLSNFKSPTYFQGTHWERREKSLSSVCQPHFPHVSVWCFVPVLKWPCVFHIQSLCSSAAAAAAAKSLQLCLTLCDPMDCSLPGFSIHGILQARTLEWVAISFSNTWKWKVKVKSLSRVQILATPWTAAYQAPPSMGFSRQQYWSGVPLPPVALLICKSVPLLPEIRKSRPSKHNFNLPLRASLVTQRLKNPPAMQETLVQFLVRKICWRRDRLSTPWASMVAQLVKNPSTVQETWVSHCPL